MRSMDRLQPTGETPATDEVDAVRVGEEPVPAKTLRCICRGHQGTIGRLAPRQTIVFPCGQFVASPFSDCPHLGRQARK
jgi:hypothetical protein